MESGVNFHSNRLGLSKDGCSLLSCPADFYAVIMQPLPLTFPKIMEYEPFTIELAPAKRTDTRIICLQGPLTITSLFDFQQELRNGAWANTILEMLGVPYMDSAGMGAIINFYVSCQRSGHKLIVCGLNYRLVELFKLTRVDKLITIADDLDHAEAMLV